VNLDHVMLVGALHPWPWTNFALMQFAEQAVDDVAYYLPSEFMVPSAPPSTHCGAPGPILKSDVLALSLFAPRIRLSECGDRFFGRTDTKSSSWMGNRGMVPRFRTPSLICGRERRCAKIEMFCFHVGSVSYKSLQYTRADAKLNVLGGVGRGDCPTERCGFTAGPARMLRYEWKR
jgi:hypothetical protein